MDTLTSIIENCTECQLCVQECPFLLKHNKTPKKLAEELAENVKLSKNYVKECFLCGLCRAVCPLDLDFPQVVSQARQKLARELAANSCYKLSLPDESLFFPTAYRTHKNLRYDSLKREFFKYAFFPGCAMSCYSPEATVKVYEKLVERFNDVSLVDQCCGKPLTDVGLSDRASKWLTRLKLYLKEHGCTDIVTACPMCYYYLQSNFQGKFHIVTIYETLRDFFRESIKTVDLKVAVHDSCPDRFKGIFAKQVRELFRDNQLVEMTHNKERSVCCGAGGLVSCADPNLTVASSLIRVGEFLESGADLMIVYCYTCAQVFWASQPMVQTKHVIDLALKTKDASENIKNQEVSKFAEGLLIGRI
ncbi:MAG: (Fe-S)-binding protein [Candidatus Bathyarchaeia archaeon]|nr:(Fe-S)-binding protein [Candidatus Bathyarchaeota archaeon]